MLSDEVALALAPFFDQIGPSHDEIAMLVRRSGFGGPRSERGGLLVHLER